MMKKLASLILALVLPLSACTVSAQDWSKPDLFSSKSDFMTEMHSLINMCAKVDPSGTNLPTSALRYNRTTDRLQEWDGSTWVDQPYGFIATGSVGTGALTDGGVTSTDIADGTIASVDIADNSVSSSDLTATAASRSTLLASGIARLNNTSAVSILYDDVDAEDAGEFYETVMPRAGQVTHLSFHLSAGCQFGGVATIQIYKNGVLAGSYNTGTNSGQAGGAITAFGFSAGDALRLQMSFNTCGGSLNYVRGWAWGVFTN